MRKTKRRKKTSDFMGLREAARNCQNLVTHEMDSTWSKGKMPRRTATSKWLTAGSQIPVEVKKARNQPKCEYI